MQDGYILVCDKLPAGRLVLLVETGLSPPRLKNTKKKNATKTPGGAARLPLPTSSPSKDFGDRVRVRVRVRVRSRVGLVRADVQG